MDPLILAQFGMGNESWWSWIVWIVFMVVFFMFYPRMMTSQIMWKLERSAKFLEGLSDRSKKFIVKEIDPKQPKVVRESVDRFYEFFAISPISMDPFGIVRKLDHIIQEQKSRFRHFTKQVAPKMGEEEQACLQMGLAGGMSLHMIAKVVRHYVELVRKTKSMQIAMIIQMQLPMIENIAKAVFQGTKSMTRCEPVGDSIGPLAVADMIGKQKVRTVEEDIVMATFKFKKRHIYAIKARGPGGRLGRPGKAVEKLVRKNRFAMVITIDAAAKLEGERTGSVAEGVGVAMGGPGVERSYIEDICVKKKLPLESIIVKMSQEEAISPMRKSIKDALPEVNAALERSLARTRAGSKVLIVGVGNTTGVGNSRKDAEKTASWVDKHERKRKLEMKGKKKKNRDSY
jgi:hypothetical protein